MWGAVAPVVKLKGNWAPATSWGKANWWKICIHQNGDAQRELHKCLNFLMPCRMKIYSFQMNHFFKWSRLYHFLSIFGHFWHILSSIIWHIVHAFLINPPVKIAIFHPFHVLTWLLADRLLGSPDSLPHEHLTVWPLTSVLWTATIACAADSLVENLIRKRILTLVSLHSTLEFQISVNLVNFQSKICL